jgi:hypothetical protein
MKTEGAIQYGLGDEAHRKDDEFMKDKIVELLSPITLDLDRDAININRESRQGERILDVDFVYHAVRYFGAEKTIHKICI